MFKNIFVGNQVFSIKEFTNKAYYHDDLIGCDVGDSYYINPQLVIIEKRNNSKYYYLNTNIECLIVNIDNLDQNATLIDCNNCKKQSESNELCKLPLDGKTTLVGITNIKSILEFSDTNNIENAINNILEYNKLIDNDLILKKKAKRRTFIFNYY